MNPKKACGADNIGAKLIQTCPDIFPQNLTVIFNRAMQDGEYPAQMKIAKVIALYKKGERYKANNYRPISLLSCFNKIFERLLSKRLIKFFDDNNLIFKCQFGFRKLYSTTLALTEFTDSIRGFLDDGNYAISIFVDLTKAFDTVDHEILLHKLDSYGIRGHVNNFFRSYLNDRSQFTEVNGEKSTRRSVKCGVPQGSVLGPLFFALYINDLHRAVGEEHVRLFADDTALFLWNRNLTTLVESAKAKFIDLHTWCVRNKLIINNEKTNFILFHTVNKPIPNNINSIETDVMKIERVSAYKYLGVYMDEIVHWSEHVNYTCTSLVKYFGIFNQIKHKITAKLSRNLYSALIYSKIKYGIEFYGSCSNVHINRVQTIQNKLMKLLLKLDPRTPTNELHRGMNILKVSDIYKSNVLNFVNEILSGRCPEPFRCYFQYKRETYDMRRKHQLNVPSTRICLGDKAVRVYGASLWNNTSNIMAEYHFKKCYRKQLNKIYISNYTVD